MPALYPSMVAPESFKIGDCVRKWVTEWNTTPFTGVVSQIVPSTSKVWVQWPIEHTAESPETLVKVIPEMAGLPSSLVDYGYGSYEKSISERNYGSIPKRLIPSRDLPPNRRPITINASDKMAIRIAHTFATDIIGKLVDDISQCQQDDLSDVQAYYRIYDKYGSYCSDHIIKSSIQKVYVTEES